MLLPVLHSFTLPFNPLDRNTKHTNIILSTALLFLFYRMLERVDSWNVQTSHFIVTQHECLWDIIPTPINHRTEEERITKTGGKVKLWKHKASSLDPRCASGPRSQMNPSRMALSWSLFPSPLRWPSTFVKVIQSYTCDYLKHCDHPTSLQHTPVPVSDLHKTSAFHLAMGNQTTL